MPEQYVKPSGSGYALQKCCISLPSSPRERFCRIFSYIEENVRINYMQSPTVVLSHSPAFTSKNLVFQVRCSSKDLRGSVGDTGYCLHSESTESSSVAQ